MFQRIISCFLQGLQGSPLEIECCLTPGLPYFNIVGLSAAAARSSRERIRSALRNTGYSMPAQRITVNIRPCLPQNNVPYLDLPIAIGLLACQALIPSPALSDSMIAGELSLDGHLQPLPAPFSFARCAAAHRCRRLLLPFCSAAQISLPDHPRCIGLISLKECIDYICGRFLPAAPPPLPSSSQTKPAVDLLDIRGQETAKRVAMVAAAGFHNLLLVGPPGIGKTMLAQSLPGLLPPLTPEESQELTQIYTLHDPVSPSSFITARPFRCPHPSISPASLLGGGSPPLPGEISLSHHGILFLDELSEHSRENLESLRLPLEEHYITLQRLNHTALYPADFLLAAGMNPCPCGHFPDRSRCRCSENQIRRYLQKISGPLSDRLDLIFFMDSVSPEDSFADKHTLCTRDAFQKIIPALERQRHRFARSKTKYNSRMTPDQVRTFCSLGSEEQAFLQSASSHFLLNPRSHKKVLMVSRTLADLDQSEHIHCKHLAEALQYRGTDLLMLPFQ